MGWDYTRYSQYMDKGQDPGKILSNIIIDFDWVKSTFWTWNEQIIACWGSLGTSQAIYFSANINPKILFLISVFLLQLKI